MAQTFYQVPNTINRYRNLPFRMRLRVAFCILTGRSFGASSQDITVPFIPLASGGSTPEDQLLYRQEGYTLVVSIPFKHTTTERILEIQEAAGATIYGSIFRDDEDNHTVEFMFETSNEAEKALCRVEELSWLDGTGKKKVKVQPHVTYWKVNDAW